MSSSKTPSALVSCLGALAALASCLLLTSPVVAAENTSIDAAAKTLTTIEMDIPPTTQGPIWPPSELVDDDGNFVVVGIQLATVPGSNIPGTPIFGKAMLVSKDTRPPMDGNGNRVVNNWFIAPFQFIRELDL